MKLLKKNILAETNNQILARWTKDSKIKFDLLPANRSIDPNHVNNLKSLILKHGMITVPLVISTTCYNKKGETKPKYFILDGQNRIQACVETNTEFYFLVRPMDSITDIITLMGEVNNSAKLWGLDDYINAYAHVPAFASQYSKLQQFTRDHSNFPTSLVASLLHYGNLSARQTKMIKKGQFEYKHEKKAKDALALLNHAESLFLTSKDATRISKRIHFRDALVSFVSSNNIKEDLNSFIISVRDHLTKVSDVPVTTAEWVDLFDRIYNNSVVTE
jgi:hypothetical protein